MSQDIQTSLCKGIRACGLPKELSYQVLNQYLKWYQNNGEEWTNDRIKGLKQWYISCLAGHPEPPPYFRKSKEGTPLGIFGSLFRVKNQAKVLAVLSANTVFQADRLTEKQLQKFNHGLQGNGVLPPSDLAKTCSGLIRTLGEGIYRVGKYTPVQVRALSPASLPDMTGTSIPVNDGKTLRVREATQLADRRQALLYSWDSIPRPVLDLLDRADQLDLVPESYTGPWSPYPMLHAAEGRPVGRIGLIQEPGLKLRSVANPNRVAQKFSEPLAQWWEAALRRFPSDCTFDQDAGVQWVQGKLLSGIELSGSDLSSATDLLNLDFCLSMADAWSQAVLRPSESSLERLAPQLEYFVQLSRGNWTMPTSAGGGEVSWKQGQPLGLYPSFRLLGITNNCLAAVAVLSVDLEEAKNRRIKKLKIHPDQVFSKFRVLGDDIIMESRYSATYQNLVRAIGGEVNLSKTVTSDRVAEFAGRIITPSRVMRKTYRYRDPGHDGFMQYVADLGPQARGLLTRSQRQLWDTFKYVPGIVYQGPWSQDSHGEPLADRVAWTESTHMFDEAPSPDRVTVSEEQQLLRLTREVADQEGSTAKETEKRLPWPLEDDIQSSQIPVARPESGDPRRAKTGQRSLEDWLKTIAADRSFSRYERTPGLTTGQDKSKKDKGHER